MMGTSPRIRTALALLAIGFVALVFIIGMTFWLASRSQGYFEEAIKARDIRSAAVELRYALQMAESSQRGYLFSGNQVYLAPYSTARTLAFRRLDTVQQLLADVPQRLPVLERLKDVTDQKFREMDQTITSKRNRQDAEALAIFRTNRGKALMDEANLFLSSIIRDADDKLTLGVDEQRQSVSLLRLATLIAAILITLDVAIVVGTILGYAKSLARARDEVDALNVGLEKRVEERTADLLRARNRAEVLLAEVNHRVANSLALVSSMVSLQARTVDSQAAKNALDETQARIYAISMVHKRLYTSGDVRFVPLDEYLSGLLDHLNDSMREDGNQALLKHRLEPLKLPTDKSIALGVVATEWVTNAFKYAYPDRLGEIRVTLGRVNEAIELSVEDDGVGRQGKREPQGTGLGSKLVSAMASSLGARLEYLDNNPGMVARLLLPAQASDPTL
jgi:two-component sensor histidine kinase